MLKFRAFRSWLPTGGLSTQLPQTNAAHQQAQRLMPRKFEGLESAMLLFCGGYGLLVAVLLLQAAMLPVILCFTLLGFGVLRWRYPTRSKLQWSIDALIAACIVAALFALPQAGGGSGPYLSLLLMFAVTFPLLMEASSAILFTGLLLAVYFSFLAQCSLGCLAVAVCRAWCVDCGHVFLVGAFWSGAAPKRRDDGAIAPRCR